MTDDRYRSGERLLLQMGAVAAIIGTVLQVAAGTSQSALLGGAGGLASLAGLLDWFWPTAYLGFVGGAGSIVVGVAIFLGLLGPGPAVPFAVVVSLFMVILGCLMWIRARSWSGDDKKG